MTMKMTMKMTMNMTIGKSSSIKDKLRHNATIRRNSRGRVGRETLLLTMAITSRETEIWFINQQDLATILPAVPSTVDIAEDALAKTGIDLIPSFIIHHPSILLTSDLYYKLTTIMGNELPSSKPSPIKSPYFTSV